MSFQYPLGLLGLIGVPILILIYIIKSKFTEQTVSATYLWTLSERFLKRKKKDNKLTGIISLILQILAVVIISFTIAHPVFTLHGEASEYCFILDSTGSMNIVSPNGKTRFEVGKDKIRDMIDNSVDGSLYTLVCVGDSTNVLFEKEADREVALELLDEAQVGHSSSTFEDALDKAKEYTVNGKGVVTYLVTDKAFEQTQDVKLIDVSDKQNNFAIFDVKYECDVLGNLAVSGKAVSYEEDAEIELVLYIDDETKDEYKLTKSVKKAEPIEFTFDVVVEDYKKASVKISNEDALMLDNEVILYNVKSENAYKTLLVSKTPFFLETVLGIVSNADVTVMEPKEYLALEKEKDTSINGYNLYIFHACNPVAVPRDGSVWLINTSASIENSGFGYQGEVILDNAQTIDKTKNTASVIREQLLKDVKGDNIYISKYSKYDTSNRRFYTLFTYDSSPVIFTGTNAHGNREVVFAFDIHNSDLPLSSDFVFLVKNLLDFSFPTVIDETHYSCGDMAQVNVVSGCESIRVVSPSGDISHVDLNEAVGEVKLTEVGTYNVEVITKEGLKTYRIYSSLGVEEQDPSVISQERISLDGKASEEDLDGIYDRLILLFICLAVIFVADWMVYCYDKYQLR